MRFFSESAPLRHIFLYLLSMNEKTSTRKEAIARRNAIDKAERARRSEQACGELVRYFAPRLRTGARIAVYHALGSEVDLSAFVAEAQRRGWECAFPVMVKAVPGSDALMTFWDVPDDGRPRAFFDRPAKAIASDDSSLKDCTPVTAREMDAVVVPLVAFDGGNHRLGYGGGNYDRFLPQLRDDAVVCGVAFEEQRVGRVPLEPHDLPLPHIVVA